VILADYRMPELNGAMAVMLVHRYLEKL